MMGKRGKVIIVGAGIVGAACARSAALEGFGVTVVDSREVGSGATAAGMGHLVVMDDSPAQLALTARSLQLWNALEPLLPPSVEFSRFGTLWIASDEAEMEEVRRKRDVYAGLGIEAAVLNPAEVARFEPNLRTDIAGALRVPGDVVLYPPCAAQWLLDQAIGHGALVKTGRVESLSGSGVTLADGASLESDFVINCAGASAARLTPGLRIRSRKGHLVITDRYPGFVRHQLLELGYLKSAHGSDGDSVAFNVQPRPTGQLLIGSSRQFDNEDPAVDSHILKRMIDKAISYMPSIQNLQAIRAWTGFRAATPDSLPLIGPHADDPRLMIAAGHEGLGITTSLATAELITDHLLGRPGALAKEAYLPCRFEGAVQHA